MCHNTAEIIITTVLLFPVTLLNSEFQSPLCLFTSCSIRIRSSHENIMVRSRKKRLSEKNVLQEQSTVKKEQKKMSRGVLFYFIAAYILFYCT